ncbi:MAG: hypothetical protein N4A49_03190 [Marinifilaceae bacterium]|jgi:hypothetical protein|nr:hypothetical protein [Marinifilaceae bacterium]
MYSDQKNTKELTGPNEQIIEISEDHINMVFDNIGPDNQDYIEYINKYSALILIINKIKIKFNNLKKYINLTTIEQKVIAIKEKIKKDSEEKLEKIKINENLKKLINSKTEELTNKEITNKETNLILHENFVISTLLENTAYSHQSTNLFAEIENDFEELLNDMTKIAFYFGSNNEKERLELKLQQADWYNENYHNLLKFDSKKNIDQYEILEPKKSDFNFIINHNSFIATIIKFLIPKGNEDDIVDIIQKNKADKNNNPLLKDFIESEYFKELNSKNSHKLLYQILAEFVFHNSINFNIKNYFINQKQEVDFSKIKHIPEEEKDNKIFVKTIDYSTFFLSNLIKLGLLDNFGEYPSTDSDLKKFANYLRLMQNENLYKTIAYEIMDSFNEENKIDQITSTLIHKIKIQTNINEFITLLKQTIFKGFITYTLTNQIDLFANMSNLSTYYNSFGLNIYQIEQLKNQGEDMQKIIPDFFKLYEGYLGVKTTMKIKNLVEIKATSNQWKEYKYLARKNNPLLIQTKDTIGTIQKKYDTPPIIHFNIWQNYKHFPYLYLDIESKENIINKIFINLSSNLNNKLGSFLELINSKAKYFFQETNVEVLIDMIIKNIKINDADTKNKILFNWQDKTNALEEETLIRIISSTIIDYLTITMFKDCESKHSEYYLKIINNLNEHNSDINEGGFYVKEQMDILKDSILIFFENLAEKSISGIINKFTDWQYETVNKKEHLSKQLDNIITKEKLLNFKINQSDITTYIFNKIIESARIAFYNIMTDKQIIDKEKKAPLKDIINGIYDNNEKLSEFTNENATNYRNYKLNLEKHGALLHSIISKNYIKYISNIQYKNSITEIDLKIFSTIKNIEKDSKEGYKKREEIKKTVTEIISEAKNLLMALQDKNPNNDN